MVFILLMRKLKLKLLRWASHRAVNDWRQSHMPAPFSLTQAQISVYTILFCGCVFIQYTQLRDISGLAAFVIALSATGRNSHFLLRPYI